MDATKEQSAGLLREPGMTDRKLEMSLCFLAWDHRRLIARVTLAGGVLAAGIAFLIPNTYKATTSLMPPQSRAGNPMMMAAGMSSQMGDLAPLAQNMLGMQAPAALFVKALASEAILNQLVERFDLERVYRVNTGMAARKILMGRTDITEDRRSGIVTISVQDHDKYRVAQLADAYVQELDKLLTQISSSGASRERLFLEGRLASVKHDLDVASQDLSQFSSKTGAVDITEQGKASFESSAKLQGQLIEGEAELKGLEEIYAPDNERVRTMKAHVAELRYALEKINTNAGSSADSDTGSLPIRELPILGSTYAALFRRTKIQESVYQMLSEQYEMAKLEEVRQVPTVRVLDPALVPEKKSGPKRSIICLAGMLLSFCGSIYWIIAAKNWQETDSDSPAKVLLQRVFTDVRQNRFFSRHRSNRSM